MTSMDKVDPNNFTDKVDPERRSRSADRYPAADAAVNADSSRTLFAGNFTDTVDPVHFVNNIELEFKNDRSRYKEFIGIMKDYKDANLNDCEVVIRISELLVGHPSLVKEFNAFLPNGYYLVPSEEGEPFITLKTPQGDTVCPLDYTRNQLASIHRPAVANHN